ncbi:MAG: sulfurtransferase TusA family protein [Pseudomonadota bacterium]
MKHNTIKMDIRGQICPSCLLLALKEVNANIEAIKRGESEIRILSDDRHATATIPDAIMKMGISTSVEKTDEGFEIRIFDEG